MVLCDFYFFIKGKEAFNYRQFVSLIGLGRELGQSGLGDVEVDLDSCGGAAAWGLKEKRFSDSRNQKNLMQPIFQKSLF